MTTTARHAALAGGRDAIARGWFTFPLTDAKVPFAGTHGHLDATDDAGAFEAAMAQRRATSYGTAAGAVSGIVVIETDPRHGGDETIAALERELGPLPPTVEAVSGGGGRHRYFAHPGGRVPSRNGDQGGLGAGVDVKADGGYVVGPGSRHKSGRTYEWEASSHPDETPLAALPPRWLARLRQPARPAAAADDGAPIPEGNRNGWLTSRGGYLRRAGFGQAAIAAALLEENSSRCAPPLPERDVAKIAASVARYPAGDLNLPARAEAEPTADPCDGIRDEVAHWRGAYAEEHRARLEAEEQRDASRQRAERAEAEAARVTEFHGAVMAVLGNKALNPAERIVAVMTLKEIAADDRGDPDGTMHQIPTERIAERAGVSVGTAAGAVKRIEEGLELPDPSGGDPVPVRVLTRAVRWGKSKEKVDPDTGAPLDIKQTYYARVNADLAGDLRTIARAVRVDPRNHGGKRTPCPTCGSTRRKSVCADCSTVLYEEPKAPAGVSEHDGDLLAAAPAGEATRENRHDGALLRRTLERSRESGLRLS